MTDSTASPDSRAQHVAAFGFLVQLASCLGFWGLAYWSKSDAIAVVARLMMVGVPIWLALFLVFKQMRRVNAEALETAELKRSQQAGADGGIFELDDEALLLEHARLRWMVRWLLPAVTVIAALLLLVGHFVGWGWTFQTAFEKEGLSRTVQPTMMMWFVVGVGFLCFLYARYATALARLPQWRIMRAGATSMAGNAMACLGLAIALMASGTIEWAEPALAYAYRVVLLVLGIEFALNLVLDLYRPRTAGEIARPSFDSRLLGLLTEPGGIAKSIAGAINYQFGFEVSKTWFYELLQRWFLPIMVAAMIIVLTMTSIVIVEAEEQVVVERLGRLVQADGAALEPGVHFKWPYPIDRVRRAPVRRLDELVIGEADAEDEHPHSAILWTESHDYVPEMMLVVASSVGEPTIAGSAKPEASSAGSESAPVSLLMVSVPVDYRIRNIHDYLYRYEDPAKIVEAVAYQYLSDYAASVDIHQLMGPGREAFNGELKRLIQTRVDDLQVGIEIVFVGVRGAHPPAKDKVAEAFQGVILAETRKGATISAHEGQAGRILTEVAGTETRAKALDAAIQRRNALKQASDVDSDALAAAKQEVAALVMGDPAKGIAPLSGGAAAAIADARTEASRRISDAATKARVFGTAIAAYEASPELFRQRRMFDVFKHLGYVRRILITGKTSNVIVEYDPREEGSLDRVLSESVDKERKGKP